MLSRERGNESPMDLDSPPAVWCNSPVPPVSPEKTTPRTGCMFKRLARDSHFSLSGVVFGMPPSSPLSAGESSLQQQQQQHRSAGCSPIKGISCQARPARRFGGLFSASPSRLRSSPLARRAGKGDDSPLSSSNSSAKKKKSLCSEDANEELSASPSKHLYLPLIIMGYLQVAFNVIMISGVLYFLLQFFLTIRRDVQIKVDEQLFNIMNEISQCSKQYVENRCSPDLRVPAMEKACLAWESCMKRDPSVVGRAKLSAETFAEIINGFIEPISYKTMVFILTALFGTIFLSNYAFSMARNRVSAGFISRDHMSAPYAAAAMASHFPTPTKSGASLLAIQ